jgi:phage tail sheath protein FI
VGTTVEIDDDFHADLNVDATSGKSVNAIRPYTGRGILIFGARTLAGNDLEWRYISVRRTFCFIEDAVRLAMQDFVFAPNTRDTWIKVKAMIGNFLNDIWVAGGLFGNSPDEAYRVSVGEPETMSDIDILEGRMIVEIKLRVARPAEFIILRYEHKFQANNN